MAGQFAIGGFVALGAVIGAGTRYPKYMSPAVGLALLALSGAVSVATIIAVKQFFA